MIAYSKPASVRNAAQGLLSKGKMVQLIVGSSENQIKFTVFRQDDLSNQMEHAFAEMRTKSLAGIAVEELKFSTP